MNMKIHSLCASIVDYKVIIIIQPLIKQIALHKYCMTLGTIFQSNHVEHTRGPECEHASVKHTGEPLEGE